VQQTTEIDLRAGGDGSPEFAASFPTGAGFSLE
jgi:hypothetical protein